MRTWLREARAPSYPRVPSCSRVLSYPRALAQTETHSRHSCRHNLGPNQEFAPLTQRRVNKLNCFFVTCPNQHTSPHGFRTFHALKLSSAIVFCGLSEKLLSSGIFPVPCISPKRLNVLLHEIRNEYSSSTAWEASDGSLELAIFASSCLDGGASDPQDGRFRPNCRLPTFYSNIYDVFKHFKYIFYVFKHFKYILSIWLCQTFQIYLWLGLIRHKKCYPRWVSSFFSPSKYE